jgi:hypothetical protein
MTELPNAKNDWEKKILSCIESSGYFLMGVNSDGIDPRYLYSIGLWHSQQHPEFIVFGLHNDAAAHVGRAVSQKIVDGHRYRHGEIDESLLDCYQCMFLEVPNSQTWRWMLSDNWLYGKEGFPVFQIVFQDEDHHWPWTHNAPIKFLENQPVIGRMPR